MKVIAYDVGTTGLKTCLFEIIAGENIRLLAGEVGEYSLTILENGGAEQDPGEWWDVVCQSTQNLIAHTGIDPEEIKGIAFCSQMQTVVLVDEEGKHLRPSMSCMDTRAQKQFEENMCTGVKVEGLNIAKVLRYLRITGALSASAKDPAWKYLWVKENEPEIYSKVYKWIDAKEYLTFRATGNLKATKDDANLTFLYDVKKSQWSKNLCKMIGVNPDHLPDLCDATDIVGGLKADSACELGLLEGTPVFGGGGDVSLCQIGSGCVDVGDVNFYSGTSGWVCTTVDKMHLDLKNLIAGIVGADPDTYNYIAELETAGKCIEWVKERLSHTPIEEYDELFDYIRDTPAGSNGVVFSPWMHGNRCPFEDSYARGVFFNVDVDSRGSDLIKAVIEGVCLHMRWMLEATEETFATAPVVRFTGGSSISTSVCQILADVLGRELETIENPRYVGVMGAAAVMAVGLGLSHDIKEIKKIIRVTEKYTPNPENTAVYNKIYPVFKNLYHDNKKSFSELNSRGC
ncbi:MAG: carbohydrate kinase [Clostridiaceae bacterium]|nr:carbohydrate kinase [Clostridiaceae bacterium]